VLVVGNEACDVAPTLGSITGAPRAEGGVAYRY
jgi:hypothetical protein